jgi:tungstate transport system ATP-binding protein
MSSSATQTAILEARDLRIKRNGRITLDVPHFAVFKGETLAIVGPNGAGKSTLLLALALLIKPNTGSIKVAGEIANSSNNLALRRRMAVVFQEPLLLDTSIADNVATGLRLRGVKGSEIRPRVSAWLNRFGITQLENRSAREISGGEAQRASLARGFALEPEVILLDEPFSALDAPTRADLTTDLSAVQRETGTTMIIVTHDLNEALSLGDRVAVMIDGYVRQIGLTDQVFGAPEDPEVAAFIGVDTIAPGIVVSNTNGLAQVKVGACPVEVVSAMPAGTAVFLALRPEDVSLHPHTSQVESNMHNILAGTIVSITPRGGQAQITIDCGFRLTATVTRRSVMEMSLSEGTPIIASFKATSAHLIPRDKKAARLT